MSEDLVKDDIPVKWWQWMPELNLVLFPESVLRKPIVFIWNGLFVFELHLYMWGFPQYCWMSLSHCHHRKGVWLQYDSGFSHLLSLHFGFFSR